MQTIDDAVKEWIRMRTILEQQLEMFTSGELRTHSGAADTTAASIEHAKRARDELDALIAQYGGPNPA